MFNIRLLVIGALFSGKVSAHGDTLHIHWYESEILGISLIMIAVLLSSVQFIAFINSKQNRSSEKNTTEISNQESRL